MTDTVSLLRHATHAAHRALESSAIARDLMSPDLTLVRYRHILQVWLRAWCVLEASLRLSTDFPRYASMLPTARTVKGMRDLAAVDRLLVAAPPDPRIDVWDTPAPIPARDEFALLGMGYVAVGSSIGGRVIARHVCATLPQEPGVITTFFDDDGGDPAAWGRWLGELNQRVVSPPQQHACTEGALATFALLQGAFASYAAGCRTAEEAAP
ncbi:MAG TPA: biliverdin-producing heme oxygenase [Dyella sp.]|nr:biliverdin-producing heme oxygenase [Dyella sp.]